MTVGEIMSRDPVCCTPETTLDQVARLMLDRDCGEIPVIDDTGSRRPLGVVTDRDIVCRAVARSAAPTGTIARDVMSAPAVTVTPEMEVEDCCRLLEQRQVRRAPVIDESGQCCGMIALADIAKHAPESITAQVVKTVSERRPLGGRPGSDVGGEIRV
jgi:CBS domain-containing protein